MLRRPLFVVSAAAFVFAAGITAGCLTDSGADATTGGGVDSGPTGPNDTGVIDSSVDISEAGTPDDPTKNDGIKDSTQNITYLDDLSNHPGCTKDGITTRAAIDTKPAGYTAAVLPNFPCAAKEYTPPATDDPNKAIVVLVHGNSSTPNDWEVYPDQADPKTQQIAEKLLADGYHVYAADFRYDKVDVDNNNNPGKNFDHGWGTPIMEALLRSLHEKYPTRKINLAGFSLGTTIIRDALRRMHHRGEKPFEFVHALLLGSGANHGVSTYIAYCSDPNAPKYQNMRSYAACQLGNRDAYQATPFLTVLNGPDGAWETPCADGLHAFGQNNVCGGNKILYTTVVHTDHLGDGGTGALEDEFVSQKSAALLGAENKDIDANDDTGYFIGGAFKHHYGSIRSPLGVTASVTALER